ncbi:AraC family transcriptional regulator [Arenimonas oryziterrae]|uniref:HTH araC/xylS-type domain-containing protein n=1 Tax=Arenimonas oryziterrae DSM 21050 = YC6267 TaxID=1121015 RepID=A0A091AUX8_9GAMM|nr:AraC family transcriptional regulator [Arenimonas oryziterrae]KFN42434.1 hypothetical protein N789_13845 [Arenimonas oryziterrae DSM 21050 = YC6267]
MKKRISDARLTEAVITTNILSCLAEVAEERGLDCRHWFSGLGLTREQIHDASVRVSYRQARLVLKRALRSLTDPGLGLDVGSRQNIGNFGVLGLAMMTARTFGDALAISVEHHRITGSLVDLDFEALDATRIAIIVRQRYPDADLLPFLCEELLSSSLMVCRTLVGESFRPRLMELAYPAPAHADRYAALFGCEVRFGALESRAIIDTRWLEFALPTYNPITAQQSLALCEAQSAALPAQNEITDAVARLLRSRLAHNPMLADIASTLNLTERTLRRQLTAAGVGFKQLHDRIRSEHATGLLQKADLTIAEIGTAVGFRDVREFRRAFKRWTGVPPRAMRNAGL